MNREIEWKNFLELMLTKTCDDYHQSEKCKYIKRYEEEINSQLETLLNKGEKQAVDEFIYELQLLGDHEGEMLYKKGMQDAVFILKQLGVLA